MFGGLKQDLENARALAALVPGAIVRLAERIAAPAGWMCVSFVTVGAVAAAAAYLPFHGDRAHVAPKARPEAAASSSRDASFVQRWHDNWKQIDARELAALRRTHDMNWLWTATPSPYATRFAALDPRAIAATPLPAPRPGDIERQIAASATPPASDQRLASLPPQPDTTPQAAPSEPGILDKLFGDPDRAAKELLAAHPNTVLYDITKRAVYMPDGTRLEAHSGFGEWMDDPDSMHRKNVGVTPPNVYSVTFREKPFHGVRALRMKPVGDGKMYGRDGILAHSYLLGEAGASNGCISIRDYDTFLKAYEDGQFNRIIVMRSIDEPVPRLIASAQ